MRANDFAAAYAVNDAVLAARDPATRDAPGAPYHERWVWDGRPFDGRRVLVRCYHGLGDTLQFSRYLAPLRARAAHVTLEVQAPLLDLLHGLPGIDALHAFDPARPLPAGECDIEVMELGHALRLPPPRAPALHVRPADVRGVGFCWAAGGWDAARDVGARPLLPLAAVAGRVISLQRGAAAAEAGLLGAVDPLQGSMDLARTAALVAGLAAVVTIDTMAAHLAGTLGRPVFLLLKREADWRWGPGQGVSAWYPTVQMFRQVRAGAWALPVMQAAEALEGTLAVVEG